MPATRTLSPLLARTPRPVSRLHPSDRDDHADLLDRSASPRPVLDGRGESTVSTQPRRLLKDLATDPSRRLHHRHMFVVVFLRGGDVEGDRMPTPRNAGKPWSAEDERQLKAMAKSNTAKEIGTKLGRTEGSVSAKAGEMRVSLGGGAKKTTRAAAKPAAKKTGVRTAAKKTTARPAARKTAARPTARPASRPVGRSAARPAARSTARPAARSTARPARAGARAGAGAGRTAARGSRR